MNIALTAFTRRGAGLGQTLVRALTEAGHQCALSLGEKLAASLSLPPSYGSLGAWTEARFADAEALIFVGACGIAVRAVAPYVKDKFTDPAVVSVDEGGRFAVPLLSGHVGGANALARQVADITGGEAVISTATDVNGLFAVDVWAAERNMAITDRAQAKEVSAALLRGERVGFFSDFADSCPDGLHPGPAELGVHVTFRAGGAPFPRTLRLVPRRLYLGIGCRRGIEEEAVREAVSRALSGLDPAAIAGAGTIDLKREEEGLLSFCRNRGIPLAFFSAKELSATPGDFTPSDFVRSVAGVDNVCERAAAALSGGRIVRPKMCLNGVTVALAEGPLP